MPGILPKLKDERAVMPFLLRIQTLAGLWGDRSQRFRFYLIFSYFCLLVVLPKVLFGYPDLEIAVRGTAELMFESNAFFGMLMFSFQRDNYERMVHQLQDLAKQVFDHRLPAELGLYLVAVNKRVDRSSKIYCCCHLSLATFFWFMPIYTTYSAYFAATNGSEPIEHVLHLEEELYWLRSRTSIVHYTIYAAIMWPTIYTLGFTGGTKLLTIFSNVRYCSAMLRLVALRVHHLDKVRRENADKELNQIIAMHQRVLDCVFLLETTFRWVFFVQFIQCTMIWCSLILYIAVTGFSSTVANVCVQIILITVETYGYCYFGTDLTTESFLQSFSVALAVYDSNWYAFSNPMRHKLRLLLQRAQKPVGITAGKFRFVSVAQFGKMLKTSYSVYVVLKEQF
ncbi:odorant receptor Or2-like [Anopheles darlingi]|uniref:odorant receptor Or2-like n=1 Tax=Anopheles darlingi TaxID=43151 RepID=UPI0021005043|nr:odorant receptor Or2-like [Anopheles darlingi]